MKKGDELATLEEVERAWSAALPESNARNTDKETGANENAASKETARQFSTKAEVPALHGADWARNKVGIKSSSGDTWKNSTAWILSRRLPGFPLPHSGCARYTPCPRC